MRASVSALAKVCNVQSKELRDVLEANKVKAETVEFTTQDGESVTFSAYDTIEVVRLMAAMQARQKVAPVTQEELDSIPF